MFSVPIVPVFGTIGTENAQPRCAGSAGSFSGRIVPVRRDDPSRESAGWAGRAAGSMTKDGNIDRSRQAATGWQPL